MRAAGYNHSFKPYTIQNLRLWLDGTDINANGQNPADGPLALWADKSQEKNDATQATGSIQPVYNSSVKGVQFEANDTMTGTFSTSMLGNQDWTIASVVFGSTSPWIANVHPVLGLGTGPGAPPFEEAVLYGVNGFDTPDRVLMGLFGGSESLVATAPSLTMFAFIGTYQASNQNTIVYLANATGSTGSGGNALDITNNIFTVGGLDGVPNFDLTGTINELVCYQRVITTDERTQLFRYFTDKWALP
jgi:hypothetical protein